MPQVNHVSRNAEHRRESREPTENVRPPGVLVVHVFDRSPLHQVEDEHALQNEERNNW